VPATASQRIERAIRWKEAEKEPVPRGNPDIEKAMFRIRRSEGLAP